MQIRDHSVQYEECPDSKPGEDGEVEERRCFAKTRLWATSSAADGDSVTFAVQYEYC